MTAKHHAYFLADRARLVGDQDVAELLRRWWDKTVPTEARESPRVADGISAWIDAAGVSFQTTIGPDVKPVDAASDPLLAEARDLLTARYP